MRPPVTPLQPANRAGLLPWARLPRRETSRRRQVKRLIFFHHVRHPAEMVVHCGKAVTGPASSQMGLRDGVMSNSLRGRSTSCETWSANHAVERPLARIRSTCRSPRACVPGMAQNERDESPRARWGLKEALSERARRRTGTGYEVWPTRGCSRPAFCGAPAGRGAWLLGGRNTG